MKKTFFLLAILAILVVSGCSKSESTPPSNNPVVPPPDTTHNAPKDTVFFNITFDTTNLTGVVVTGVHICYMSNEGGLQFIRNCKTFKEISHLYATGDTATRFLGIGFSASLDCQGYMTPFQYFYFDYRPSYEQMVDNCVKVNNLSWRVGFRI